MHHVFDLLFKYEGEFGIVYKAKRKKSFTDASAENVAVKTLKGLIVAYKNNYQLIVNTNIWDRESSNGVSSGIHSYSEGVIGMVIWRDREAINDNEAIKWQ